MRRIVVTGLGVVSASGIGINEFWPNIRDGRCAIGKIESFDTSGLRVDRAAVVGELDEGRLPQDKLPLLDRYARFALIAAAEAVEDAGVDKSDLSDENAVSIIGTGMGGQNTLGDAYWRLYGENATRLHPFTIPKAMPSSAASQLSMRYGLRGPTFAVSSACSSSNHAIGLTFQLLRAGVSDIGIAGGAEASLTPATVKAWEGLRVLSSDLCRPFCTQRNGTALGEGAGVFVLETLEHAQARGAAVHAEIIGFAMNADATDIVQPNPVTIQQCMQRALADANVTPEDVDYVNAHGTGTRTNDAVETEALHAVFPSHADRLWVSSTKSMHGHAMGASGALEFCASVMGIREGWVPPTVNFGDPDSQCDLDYVPNEGRQRDIEVAMCNSFAFGGLNAVLVVRRFAS